MVLSSAPRLVLLSVLVLVPALGTRARAGTDAGNAAQPVGSSLPSGKGPGAQLASPPPFSLKAAGAQPASAKPAGPKVGKKAARSKNAAVVLYHLNRRDTMTLRLRDAQGKPIKGQQRRFDRFLRCHYTNKQHSMNPRLVRLLYQTGRHWPGKRLEVVSGYRNPTVAKNPRSPHMKGLACDFRVAGVKNTDLRDYLRGNMKKVGVGYYPNSSFVHLDVRKDRSAFWIDYSGPGDRAMYSETPAEDLKTGRAENYHPTKIGDDWLNDAPPNRSGPVDDESEAKNAASGPVPGTALAGRPGAPPQSATP
jgi:uncharacterized protein YcbK (DUF882 family)